MYDNGNGILSAPTSVTVPTVNTAIVQQSGGPPYAEVRPIVATNNNNGNNSTNGTLSTFARTNGSAGGSTTMLQPSSGKHVEFIGVDGFAGDLV